MVKSSADTAREREALVNTVSSGTKVLQVQFLSRPDTWLTRSAPGYTVVEGALEALLRHGQSKKLLSRGLPSLWAHLRSFPDPAGPRQITAAVRSLPKGAKDVSRLRAWIRACLNDSCLADAVDRLARDPGFTAGFEKWAVLRDPEWIEVLVPLLAGLESLPMKLSLFDLAELANPSPVSFDRSFDRIASQLQELMTRLAAPDPSAAKEAEATLAQRAATTPASTAAASAAPSATAPATVATIAAIAPALPPAPPAATPADATSDAAPAATSALAPTPATVPVTAQLVSVRPNKDVDPDGIVFSSQVATKKHRKHRRHHHHHGHGHRRRSKAKSKDKSDAESPGPGLSSSQTSLTSGVSTDLSDSTNSLVAPPLLNTSPTASPASSGPTSPASATSPSPSSSEHAPHTPLAPEIGHTQAGDPTVGPTPAQHHITATLDNLGSLDNLSDFAVPHLDRPSYMQALSSDPDPGHASASASAPTPTPEPAPTPTSAPTSASDSDEPQPQPQPEHTHKPEPEPLSPLPQVDPLATSSSYASMALSYARVSQSTTNPLPVKTSMSGFVQSKEELTLSLNETHQAVLAQPADSRALDAYLSTMERVLSSDYTAGVLVSVDAVALAEDALQFVHDDMPRDLYPRLVRNAVLFATHDAVIAAASTAAAGPAARPRLLAARLADLGPRHAPDMFVFEMVLRLLAHYTFDSIVEPDEQDPFLKRLHMYFAFVWAQLKELEVAINTPPDHTHGWVDSDGADADPPAGTTVGSVVASPAEWWLTEMSTLDTIDALTPDLVLSVASDIARTGADLISRAARIPEHSHLLRHKSKEKKSMFFYAMISVAGVAPLDGPSTTAAADTEAPSVLPHHVVTVVDRVSHALATRPLTHSHLVHSGVRGDCKTVLFYSSILGVGDALV